MGRQPPDMSPSLPARWVGDTRIGRLPYDEVLGKHYVSGRVSRRQATLRIASMWPDMWTTLLRMHHERAVGAWAANQAAIARARVISQQPTANSAESGSDEEDAHRAHSEDSPDTAAAVLGGVPTHPDHARYPGFGWLTTAPSQHAHTAALALEALTQGYHAAARQARAPGAKPRYCRGAGTDRPARQRLRSNLGKPSSLGAAIATVDALRSVRIFYCALCGEECPAPDTPMAAKRRRAGWSEGGCARGHRASALPRG